MFSPLSATAWIRCTGVGAMKNAASYDLSWISSRAWAKSPPDASLADLAGSLSLLFALLTLDADPGASDGSCEASVLDASFAACAALALALAAA